MRLIGTALEPNVAQAGKVVGPTTEIPTKLALNFCDGTFVDAGDAALYQTIRRELPVFVAVGSKPIAEFVAILIRKTNRDPTSDMCPYLIDVAVFELSRPLPFKEGYNRVAAAYKLRPVAPMAVCAIAECYAIGIAAIPRVFSQSSLLYCGRFIERREGWSAHVYILFAYAQHCREGFPSLLRCGCARLPCGDKGAAHGRPL